MSGCVVAAAGSLGTFVHGNVMHCQQCLDLACAQLLMLPDPNSAQAVVHLT